MYIEIKNLSKYYGEGANRNKVLNSIDISIEQGKICTIIGSSGSGKSTLLNCIGGLETVDEGNISIDGVDITQLNAKKLAMFRRESLGFIFQFYNLIPNLSVAENVDLCRYLTKNPLDRDTLLETLGILDKKDSLPNMLSGGQQQRCSIARALIKNPKILLCDEPTGALDSSTAYDIICLLEKINIEYGTTILLVTHNPAIIPMSHQVISISDGRILDSYFNKNRIPAKDLTL